jgi:hypothetical protein
LVQLDEPPLDNALFVALEQQIAWHDSLIKQQQFEGAALLPCASQCMLDLLVQVRECMHEADLNAHLNASGPRPAVPPPTPWTSTLPFMSDVAELSALTKWLLEPIGNVCPRVSVRLAYRASQQTTINWQIFAEWGGVAMDAKLVGLIEKVTNGGGLNVRPGQLQTVGEQAKELGNAFEPYAANELTFRAALLHRFNQLLARHLPLVHTGLARKGDSTLGGRICKLRAAVLTEIKSGALEQALSSTTSDSDAMIVLLNRFKAMKQRPRADAEGSGVGTLFVQLHTQIGRVKPRALCRQDKAFRCNFVGEAADDHGGPYREAIASICSELQSPALPLFIRCPNGVHGVGAHRDAYVPNPSAVSSQQIDWFFFVGQLLGLALRQKETQLALSLPSVVWKQLVAQPMDASDLEAFDAMCLQSLDKLRHIDDEGVDASTFSDVIFETFVTQLSDGSDVALLPGGAGLEVTYDGRLEFCDLVQQARLHEASQQCDAILQGLSSLVPQRLLSLFTWDQLELLACGSKDIDIEVLRSKTKYGVGVSPAQRHVRYFWQTLKKFSPERRALFLRFVWGRTRLPATAREWGDVRFTLHTRHTSSPDSSFPVAHTCFFSMELPAYSTAAITYEKILYAISNCQDIDIDTTTSARENRERHVEESDDETVAV